MEDFLVSWTSAIPLASGDRSAHEMAIVRALAPAESDRTRSAYQAIARFTHHSPLVELELAKTEVQEAYEALLAAVARNDGSHLRAMNDLHRQFSAWLAAFRAFQDRVKHALSQQYGPDSGDYLACVQFFSAEFDASAAYRFSEALRNISEHRDRVLNEISTGIRVGRRGKEPFARVAIDVVQHVANDTKKRIRAATRDEMLQCPGHIDALALVTYATMACNRIAARRIWHDRVELRRSIGEVKGWHDEVVAHGGDVSFFATEDQYDAIKVRGKVELRVNPIVWVPEVEENLRLSERIESQGPVPITTREIVVGEPL